MERFILRCAGLDVRPGTVVACARVVDGEVVTDEFKTFGHFPTDLDALAAWLRQHECSHAALEPVGRAWKPVWGALKDSLTLVLISAMPASGPDPADDKGRATSLADALARELVALVVH